NKNFCFIFITGVQQQRAEIPLVLCNEQKIVDLVKLLLTFR
ncbi:3986_t:CDS:2, partial [Dentiscutata erythropus]